MRGSNDGSKNFIFMSLIGTCGHSIIEHNICIIIIISYRSIHMTSSTLKERCSCPAAIWCSLLPVNYLFTYGPTFICHESCIYISTERRILIKHDISEAQKSPSNMSWLMKLWRENSSHCLTTLGYVCLLLIHHSSSSSKITHSSTDRSSGEQWVQFHMGDICLLQLLGSGGE